MWKPGAGDMVDVTTGWGEASRRCVDAFGGHISFYVHRLFLETMMYLGVS